MLFLSDGAYSAVQLGSKRWIVGHSWYIESICTTQNHEHGGEGVVPPLKLFRILFLVIFHTGRIFGLICEVSVGPDKRWLKHHLNIRKIEYLAGGFNPIEQ